MSIVKINVRTQARATKKKISIYKNNSFTLTLPLNIHRDVLCEQIKERLLHELSLSYVDRISASLQITVHNNGEKVFFDFAREGDTIYIHDFSRLARSTKDLLDIVELLQKKNVHLVSNKENIDSSTPTGKLMLTMIAAINEFERANLLERQREGIAIAKRNGVYKGRKAVVSDKFEDYYQEYINRTINKVEFAKKLKISRPTLDKLIKEREAS